MKFVNITVFTVFFDQIISFGGFSVLIQLLSAWNNLISNIFFLIF